MLYVKPDTITGGSLPIAPHHHHHQHQEDKGESPQGHLEHTSQEHLRPYTEANCSHLIQGVPLNISIKR